MAAFKFYLIPALFALAFFTSTITAQVILIHSITDHSIFIHIWWLKLYFSYFTCNFSLTLNSNRTFSLADLSYFSILSKFQSCDDIKAGLSNGDEDFCTDACPCTGGQGDCDSDDQCSGSLVCAPEIGGEYGFFGADLCAVSISFH